LSNKAITWALQQPTGSSGTRQLLMVLADVSSDEPSKSRYGKTWPAHHAYLSIAALVERTLQDRKTVIANLNRLELAGFIARGGTDGRTNQTSVFKLATDRQFEAQPIPILGLVQVPKAVPVPKPAPVPHATVSGTSFSRDQYRFSVPPVPKAGHETQVIPMLDPKNPKAQTPDFFRSSPDLPAEGTAGGPVPASKKPCKEKAPTAETWDAYSAAYEARYGVHPVRNATVNGQLANLVGQLGAEEAPQVAAFYVNHEDPFYLKKAHPVGLLLGDAQKLRMEWKTGRANAPLNNATTRWHSRQPAGDLSGKNYAEGLHADALP
jgi:hypothetical protein